VRILHIEGKETEQMKEFCYLGSRIATNAKCHKENFKEGQQYFPI